MTLPVAYPGTSGPATYTTVTTGSLTLTASTPVPTNGLYLPAANTVGIATDSTLRVSVSTSLVTLAAGMDLALSEGKVTVTNTADESALNLVSSATSAHILNIGSAVITTGRLISCDGADALTIGSIAFFKSDSASTATRYLVDAFQANASATGATTLRLRNASTGNALLVETGHVGITAGNLVLGAGDLIITTPTTPASASATGTIGTIAWDTGFIYVCTATDTWERVAIASW